MEKTPRNNQSEKKAESDDSKKDRRGFLGMLGAVALVSSLPNIAKANVEMSPYPQPRPRSLGEDVDYSEQLKEYTYQAYEAPNVKSLNFTTALHRDLDLVMERMSTMVEGDDRYSSAMQLIHDQLQLNIPEPINYAVRDMMMYVPYVESRFSNEAVSSAQAFGFMQLMPSAWEELSREDEQRGNIIDQVKVAGRLLNQTYRHLMNQHADTFDLISRLLFQGDMDKCGKEFIGPLLINGYFSGMGTIDRVLDGFLADYVNETEKTRMQQEGILDDEMGVYGLFSTAGELHGYARNYGAESVKYVPKILAAKLVMRIGLSASLLAELMPQVENSETSS